eukprot:gene4374-5379_t
MSLLSADASSVYVDGPPLDERVQGYPLHQQYYQVLPNEYADAYDASKLNPYTQDFVPSFFAPGGYECGGTVFFPNSGGMMYGAQVFPSKTPIIPVNPSFLPKTDTEREMCERTVYVTHIDKAVAVSTVRQFFEETCGEVLKLRILGDTRHPTQIAFVEFLCSESANAALGCSGTVIGANSYALPN